MTEQESEISVLRGGILFMYTQYARVVFILLSLICMGTLILASTLGAGRPTHQYIAHLFAKWYFWSIGIHVRVHDRKKFPKRGPLLFISNHQTYLDQFLLYAAFPSGFSSMYTYQGSEGELNFLGPLLSRIGIIPVEPGDPKSVERGLHWASRQLEENRIFMIMPEETPTRSGDPPRRFKRGCGWILVKKDVPVQFIYLKNAVKITPHPELLSPGLIECYIGSVTKTDLSGVTDGKKDRASMIADYLLKKYLEEFNLTGRNT